MPPCMRRTLVSIGRLLALAVGVGLVAVPALSYGQGGPAWSPSVAVYPGTDLEFGQAGSGEGEVEVYKSSSSGGSFEIKSQLTGSQRIRVEITADGEMIDYGNDGVPYELRAAYNENADSRSGATEMAGLSVELDPNANQVNQGPGPPYRSAFVYVYGTATVGSVGSGTYSDAITLHAEIVGGPGDDDDWDEDDDDDEDDEGEEDDEDDGDDDDDD